MTQHLIETLLFASVAMNAAMLLFITDILGKMMNAVDVAAFKNLIALMYRYSTKSAFMIIGLNLPMLVAILYYYAYGFDNRWITAGLLVWLFAGSLSKIYKLPVYKALVKLDDEAVVEIEKQRRKFNAGNLFQAILYVVATVLVGLGLR